MSQSQDVSEVLSDLTQPHVDHQSRTELHLNKLINNDLEVADPL